MDTEFAEFLRGLREQFVLALGTTLKMTCLASSGLPSKSGSAAPSKKTRAKITKDATSKPRRASSAYSHFLKSRFQSLREEDPGLTFAAASKIIAQEWGAMGVCDKAKYQTLHEKDKMRYARELKALTCAKLLNRRKAKPPVSISKHLSSGFANANRTGGNYWAEKVLSSQ